MNIANLSTMTMMVVPQHSTIASLIDCIANEKENKTEMRRLAFSGIKHKVLMNQLKVS